MKKQRARPSLYDFTFSPPTGTSVFFEKFPNFAVRIEKKNALFAGDSLGAALFFEDEFLQFCHRKEGFFGTKILFQQSASGHFAVLAVCQV